MDIKLSDHFTRGRLLRFTLPSIAMLLFASVYGMVDGYFVSNFVGKQAFSAVNLVTPLTMFVSTIGFMFGAGGTAIVSRTLGEKDPEKANNYFSLFVYVTLVIGAVFALLGITFIRPIVAALGAEGRLLEDSVLYARIVMAAMPFFALQMLFNSFFPAAERPQLGFRVTVACGLTNIIGDALLVLLLPQPYKLAGAAVATMLSQMVGGIVPIVYFAQPNGSLLRLGRTELSWRIILEGCVNGSSEFVNNAAMSIVSTLFNMQLLKFAGENGVAAYGVMMYIGLLFAAAFIGYTIGTAPIIGYNYGAKNHAELHSVLAKSLQMLGICGICMTISAEALAIPLGRIFVGYDAELMALTVSGFRIFALSFLFCGFAMFISGFFTALSDGLTSALISFLRTLVFEAGAVMILPSFFGVNGIWVSVAAADVMALILSGSFLLAKRKRFGY